jgi:hypothetical protein
MKSQSTPFERGLIFRFKAGKNLLGGDVEAALHALPDFQAVFLKLNLAQAFPYFQKAQR